MRVCFLLKNIRINFRFRFCLQVHDSRCALVLFTDFTLKLCNSYVVIAKKQRAYEFFSGRHPRRFGVTLKYFFVVNMSHDTADTPFFLKVSEKE